MLCTPLGFPLYMLELHEMKEELLNGLEYFCSDRGLKPRYVTLINERSRFIKCFTNARYQMHISRLFAIAKVKYYTGGSRVLLKCQRLGICGNPNVRARNGDVRFHK